MPMYDPVSYVYGTTIRATWVSRFVSDQLPATNSAEDPMPRWFDDENHKNFLAIWYPVEGILDDCVPLWDMIGDELMRSKGYDRRGYMGLFA